MTTPFQERVYALIKHIPRGKVSTYKRVAHELGVRSYQAVGNALRENPHAPTIPCHRVVKTDRTLGGYAGSTSGEKPRKKRRLLEEEGVLFSEDGRVRNGCLHEF